MISLYDFPHKVYKKTAPTSHPSGRPGAILRQPLLFQGLCR